MFRVLLGNLIGPFGFTQTVDTKPQPRGAINLSQPLTPNGPYRESAQLEPMSQLQLRNVIRQVYDYGRGSVTLATLLDYYPGRNLEERQVMERLLRYGEVDKIVRRHDFSLLDMKHHAAALGYKSGSFRVGLSDLGALEHPALVPIYYADFKHFMVMHNVYSDHVFVANPALGNISFARMCFEKIQDQNVLFVIFPSGQEPRNMLTLNSCDMRLVDDRTVSLLAFREFLQINKIIENQVRELGAGDDVIHLRIKQQMPKNKNSLWG